MVFFGETDMLEFITGAFVMLLIIIDPPGIVPVFLSLTPHYGTNLRKSIAVRASLISLGLLLTFAFIGDFILDNLGISEPAFQMAGGVLLLLMAIEMVFARPSGIHTTTRDEQEEALHKDDITVFPLSIPMIAGPGALTAVVILTRKVEHDLMLQIALAFVIIAVIGMTYLCLRLADPIARLLGVTGSNVLGRVFGIILSALAIQFIANGIVEILNPLFE